MKLDAEKPDCQNADREGDGYSPEDPKALRCEAAGRLIVVEERGVKDRLTMVSRWKRS